MPPKRVPPRKTSYRNAGARHGYTMKRVDAPPCLSPKTPHAQEKLADPKYYQANKRQLFRALCTKDDPPPRLVKAGSGPQFCVLSNVASGRKEMLRQGVTTKFVRGWKLRVVDARGTIGDLCWRAVPHAVFEVDGRYVCCTADDAGQCFIFMPSRRMAAECSDEELEAGGKVLKSVVGGNLEYVRRATGAYPEKWSSSPELARSVEAPAAHMPHGVKLWLELVLPEADPTEVGLAIGFPSVPMGTGQLPLHALTAKCCETLNDIVKREGNFSDVIRELTPILLPKLKETRFYKMATNFEDVLNC